MAGGSAPDGLGQGRRIVTALAALRGRVAREVVSLRPVPGAERAAARIAVTTLVAQGVLVAAGRIDLAVYATFGAFACVYGGRWPVPGRWRTQARMGTVMASSLPIITRVRSSSCPSPDATTSSEKRRHRSWTMLCVHLTGGKHESCHISATGSGSLSRDRYEPVYGLQGEGALRPSALPDNRTLHGAGQAFQGHRIPGVISRGFCRQLRLSRGFFRAPFHP